MITRCDATDDSVIQKIERTVCDTNNAIPIVRCTHRPTGLLEYPSRVGVINELSGHNVGVVSAIGNPEAFDETVRACGATIVDSRHLPDHDAYSPETVRDLRAWAESLGGRIDQVICTHKDLVKLRTDRLGGHPLSAVLIELSVESGADRLEEALNAIVQRCS